MRLYVNDVFRDHVEPVQGSPLEVEETLRLMFRGCFSEVPRGDLHGILAAINRMYGYTVVITESSDYHGSPYPYPDRPVNNDPWEREYDDLIRK